MLRNVLASVVISGAALIAASAASAADLPLKAAPMAPAPSFTWTGFYVGGHVGAGWGTAESQLLSIGALPVNLPLASQTANGFLGGVQAGYNHQVGQWVLGVEGDFSWNDMESSSPCLVILTCSGKVKWTADFTGRLGVTVDRALVYVKGGVAWAKTDYTAALALGGLGFSTTTTDTRIGGLLGMGVEYAVSRNWSAKIEYNYTDFGKENENFLVSLGGPAVAATSSINQQFHAVKAGANYRF